MKYITGLFALFIIVVIVFADLGWGNQYFILIRKIPNGDKIGHFFLVGILAFFVNLSLSCKTIQFHSVSMFKGSLILGILFTLEEISQLFVSNRTFSFLDLFFDYLGIVCFGNLAYLIYVKRSKTESGI